MKENSALSEILIALATDIESVHTCISTQFELEGYIWYDASQGCPLQK